MQENSSLVPANGIELCYDTFGERTAPPLLLIMGLAAQMIAWDEAFCEQLAARGYFVIRFDNRDIGRSTRFPQYGTPDLMALLGQALMGKPIAAPYTLRDMAADGAGLLDALGIERAHVVGRVDGRGDRPGDGDPPRRAPPLVDLHHVFNGRSEPSAGHARGDGCTALASRRPTATAISQSYKRTWAVLRGPGFPLDEARDLERAARAWDRGLNPPGRGAADGGHPRVGQPHLGTRQRARADARDPWK